MAAIMNLDPSLIQYLGGAGKGLSAIGGSMSSVGQAKLALEQQDRENKSKQAYFDLQKGMYDQGQKDKFDAKNEGYAKNVATNAFLLGQDAPQEMSNEYARLSMIDPTITAAAMKRADPEFGATDGGLIYNKRTGVMANDYRDKTTGSKISSLPNVSSIVGGKEVKTYYNPDGSVALRISGDGTPMSTYNLNVSDAIGDNNVPQRMDLKDVSGQKIEAVNYVAKGYVPVRFSSDPKVAAKQQEYAAQLPDGKWYVSPNLAASYQKRFLQAPPPLKKGSNR